MNFSKVMSTLERHMVAVMVIFLAIGISTTTGTSMNLALGKATGASSTHSGNPGRAVDGNHNTNGKGGYCTHTLYHGSSNPWWRVDLGQVYAVGSVNITNRGDCCGNRLRDFTIKLRNGSSSSDPSNQCYHHAGPVDQGATININCEPGPSYGQYLYIQLIGDDRILSLCEVEVYGAPPPDVPATTTTTEATTTSTGVKSGEYVCGNNGIQVKFPASVNSGVTYEQIFVTGYSDDAICSTSSVDGNGMLALNIDDLASCNVTADADGVANVILNLQEHIGFDSAEDGYVNLTCNVNGEPVVHSLKYVGLKVQRGDHKQLDVKKSQPPQAEVKFVKDGQTVMEAILGERIQLCVEASFDNNEYSSLSIIDVTSTGDRHLINKGCKSDEIPGTSPGFPTTDLVTRHVCFDFQTFRFHGQTTASFTVEIEFHTAVKNQANGNTCVSSRRKRSDDKDEHVTRTLFVSLPLMEVEESDVGSSEQSSSQDNSEKYVDRTLFYVVVAVLVVLLTIALGVAVFFANRTRIVHVAESKLTL